MSDRSENRVRPLASRRVMFAVVLLAGAWLPQESALAQPYVFEKFVGGDGAGPGKFGSYVTDVAIDAQGRSIVIDSLFGTYEVCNDNGGCEEFGGQGDAPGEFTNPYGVERIGRINHELPDLASMFVQRRKRDSCGGQMNWA